MGNFSKKNWADCYIKTVEFVPKKREAHAPPLSATTTTTTTSTTAKGFIAGGWHDLQSQYSSIYICCPYPLYECHIFYFKLHITHI